MRRLLVLLGLLVGACERPAPKLVASKNEGVPVNSAAEDRLNGTTPKPTPSVEPEKPPPPPTSEPPEAPTPKSDAKLTKAECRRLFDKYIDLTIVSTGGISPEAIKQMKATAKAQAQAKKMDPCSKQDVSRTQYACAIASTSSAAWQRCMK